MGLKEEGKGSPPLLCMPLAQPIGCVRIFPPLFLRDSISDWFKSSTFISSGIIAGDRVPQHFFLTRKVLLTYQEKKGKEKSENGEEKKENQKREGGKLKMEGGKVTKWREDFFFFFFFFCFSLFKTTVIFGSTKMGIFYQEKAFHARKKIRKNDFAPCEKYSLYASVHFFVTYQQV